MPAHSHPHDALISRKVDFPARVDVHRLIAVLEKVPAMVFRIKGIVDLVGRGPTLVQFVGGRFNLGEFQNPQVSEQFMVLIGHQLEAVVEAIQSLANPEERGNVYLAGDQRIADPTEPLTLTA